MSQICLPFLPFFTSFRIFLFGLFFTGLVNTAAARETFKLFMPGDSTIEATICANETFQFNGQSYNTTGEYSATFIASDGSDSTVTLVLSVLPTSSEVVNATICQGETYEFFGLALMESGEYEAVLPGFNGCDSTVILKLTVLPNVETNLSASICTGSAYVFQGDTLTETGAYTANFQAENGCDSTVVLHLNVVDSFVVQLVAQICNGESYLFGGTILTTEGVYIDSLTAVGGCDSVVTLTLRIRPLNEVHLHASICTGAQFTFNGDTLTVAGDYVYADSDQNGCDSITYVHLEVADQLETTQTATICAGETYTFGGSTLDTEGIYTDTLTANGGCDSIVTLVLNVLPVPLTIIDAAICDGDSYTYNGATFSDPGDYEFVYTAANGCDSIVVISLVVNETPNTVLEAVICAGTIYNFYGEQLTETGVYEEIFQSALGCDSTISLILTVLPELSTAINASICANETYDFNGEMLDSAGVYSQVLVSEFGCDSTVTLNLSVLPTFETTLAVHICLGETYVFDGSEIKDPGEYVATFSAENGCDSTVTLQLTVLPVSTSELNDTICNGATYLFNGESLTASGVYSDTLTGQNGCDSIVVLTLTVLPTFSSSFEAVICEGDAFSYYGQLLTEAGSFEFNHVAQNGCDSIVTVHISVIPLTYGGFEAEICEGETYEYQGESLTETGTYQFAFDGSNGCDSIVFVYLYVWPTSETTLNVSLCEGASYEFNGATLTVGGSYIAEYTSVHGCDSTIVLNLSFVQSYDIAVEASICAGTSYQFDTLSLQQSGVYSHVYTSSGGCDSTVTLTLTVLPADTSTTLASICTGGSYAFNGFVYTQAGTYTANLSNANGCDSVAVLVLDVLPTSTSTTIATICEGESYTFNGFTFDESGTYTAGLTNANGCDSIALLELTVYPASHTSFDATTCANEGYPFGGILYVQSGQYSITLQTINGCDSIVTLNLTVFQTTTNTITVSTCEGEPYIYNGNALDQSGTYTYALTGSNGCDSTVVINLTIHPPILPLIIDAFICEGDTIFWNGQVITSGGDYEVHFTTAAGCDSTIILGLSEIPAGSLTIQASICHGESYLYNGVALTQSGVYDFNYQTPFGCDSTVTVVLAVEPPLNVSVTQQNGTLTAQVLANAYQWIDCANNQAIPGATGNNFTPGETGQYAVVVTGATGCTTVSNCVDVIISGTNDPLGFANSWQLYPNPAGAFTVVKFKKTLAGQVKLDIMDAAGSLLYSRMIDAGTDQLELPLDTYPSGWLLVRLSNETTWVAKPLLKQGN